MVPKKIDKVTAIAERETSRSADSSDRAYQTIRELLVDFKLKPGERINEMHLAKSLNLSRTPVREALNRLASEGFVTLTPNKGFHVRSLSTEGLLDLYEYRAVIECAAFRLMCERAQDDQILRLKTYWDAIANDFMKLTPDDAIACDEGFHMLICELSGNVELVNQLATINARIRFIRRIQIQHHTQNVASLTWHAVIVDSAIKRDKDGGAEILRQHIQITVEATQEALKDALYKVYSMDEKSKMRATSLS